MGCLEEFVKGVLPMAAICLLGFFLFACIKPIFQNSDEYYNIEKVVGDNGHTFYIIHDIGCPIYQKWFGREPKSHFVKDKCDVFCRSCINAKEAALMNEISERMIENIPIEDFDELDHLDESERTYELIWVYDKRFNVIRASKEDMERLRQMEK